MAFLAEQSKNLLKRTIKHTEIHNKAWEERKMWKERRKEKERSRREPQRKRSYSPDYPCKPSTSADSFAHGGDLLKWTNKLYELESGMDDRWKHDGFKELHPQFFNPKPSLDLEIVAEIFNPEPSSTRIHRKYRPPSSPKSHTRPWKGGEKKKHSKELSESRLEGSRKQKLHKKRDKKRKDSEII